MPLIDYLPSVVEDTEIKMVLEAIVDTNSRF